MMVSQNPVAKGVGILTQSGEVLLFPAILQWGTRGAQPASSDADTRVPKPHYRAENSSAGAVTSLENLPPP